MKSVKSQNKVIKAGAGYVIGNYLLKGITFLSAPIFTRLLTTEEFGDFGTYTSYEAILYILVGLALHVSINNAKYKYKDKFEEYISSIVLLTAISTFVWLIMANIFYDSYKQLFDFSRLIINIMILHCFGSAMFQFYNSYVSLNYSVKSFLKITSINALLNMGLSILLLLTFFSSSRLLGRIVGVAVPLIGISIYIALYFFRKSKPIIKKEYWKFALVYSLPIIPHGISQIILSSFDRIMIRKMVGSTEAGLYNFAYTINTLINVASTSLDNVWRPWIYEKLEAKDYKSVRTNGFKYAFGMALFTCLVIMVSPELIKILGAREYWSSTNCVIPVVIGGYFAFICTLPVMIEYFYEKTKYIAIGTTTAAIINIILNYFCILKFGYIAAAYTTMITYFLYFIFHFILASKIHGSSLFSATQLLGICAVVVLVGAIAMLLQKYFIIRWIIELCFLIYSFIWADKNLNMKELILKKLNKSYERK